jgi:hypothetical protein
MVPGSTTNSYEFRENVRGPALDCSLPARPSDGVPASDLRRRAAPQFQGPKGVLRPETERQPLLRRWGVTIAVVYREGQPEDAGERVRAWDRAICEEL